MLLNMFIEILLGTFCLLDILSVNDTKDLFGGDDKLQNSFSSNNKRINNYRERSA